MEQETTGYQTSGKIGSKSHSAQQIDGQKYITIALDVGSEFNYGLVATEVPLQPGFRSSTN